MRADQCRRARSLTPRPLPLDGASLPPSGNEYRGISPFWSREADARFVLPMVGFVQSYNISTSVAMALYELRLDRVLDAAELKLNPDEQDATALRWLMRDVRSTPNV